MDAALRQKMALCRECYGRAEYERVEGLLLEIIAEYPGSAEMFNMLGVVHHHAGRFAEARRMFAQALHLNPRYTEAALNLSVVLSDTGRYDEAQAAYAPVLERAAKEPQGVDPFARGKLANMHAATAEAYRELGLLSEASTELRRALHLCPGFPDLHLRLGTILSEMGDREGAVAAYREAVSHDPRYVQGRIQLGVELYALGSRDEARAEWEQALALDPENRRLPIYLKLAQ